MKTFSTNLERIAIIQKSYVKISNKCCDKKIFTEQKFLELSESFYKHLEVILKEANIKMEKVLEEINCEIVTQIKLLELAEKETER